MRAVLGCLTLVAMLVACGPQKLPGGYEAVSSDGDWYIVAPDKSIAVEPDVRTIALVGTLIVGTVGGATDVGAGTSDPIRFFVLDTGAGRTDYFESDEEWRSFLRRRGIESPPQLKSPAPLSLS